MRYDLFISYSRRDNNNNRITELVELIKEDYKIFDKRELNIFFDTVEIKCMEDWRHSILKGLRQSHLMLACLSPSYLKSEYCEWEFNEYLNNEINRAPLGEGVAPVYFVEVPGWDDKDFDEKCADWIKELRRRQHIDLRPWFHEGQKSLRDLAVKDRLDTLKHKLKERIQHNELKETRIGNIDAHSPHFIGRINEMRTLIEHLQFGKIGILTAINGLGGVGKTALAVGYANAYAHHYGGGCWQIRCEGKDNLILAVAELASVLRLSFNETERKDPDLQFQRVIAELDHLKSIREPHKCLLILDNVDRAELLAPETLMRLSGYNWLQIIVTTRLGANHLYGSHQDRIFLSVDELPDLDAVKLIESYQPGGVFKNEEEREIVLEIVHLLGGFTLAVESVAVFLGRFYRDVSFSDFLDRLKKEGFPKWDLRIREKEPGIRHGEQSMVITLKPTIEKLTEAEKTVLGYAACLPPDNIPLSWIKNLISEKYPEFRDPPEPGYPDQWSRLRDRLIDLRLLKLPDPGFRKKDLFIVKMHRIVQKIISECLEESILERLSKRMNLEVFLLKKAEDIQNDPRAVNKTDEVLSLFEVSKLIVAHDSHLSKKIASLCSHILYKHGFFAKSLQLAEDVINEIGDNQTGSHISHVWCYNMAGVAALSLYKNSLAEKYFIKARDFTDNFPVSENDNLETITNLSCFYREIFQPEKALDLSIKSLKLAEEIHGPRSDEAALHCANLGLVYQDLSEIDNAIFFLSRAVEIDRKSSTYTINTSSDMGSLAEALRNKGLITEAETLAKEAIELIRVNGLENHPSALTNYINLSRILEEKDEYDEARHLLNSALDFSISNYGENSHQTANVLNNLGINSLLTGNISQAVYELEKALKIERTGKELRLIKIAHRELNLGVAYLLNENIEKSREIITYGWGHLQETGQFHILAARLLIVRIIISEILSENSKLFLGQINTLLKGKSLLSSGVDIRWSLEQTIKEIIMERIPDFLSQFEYLYQLVLDKKLNKRNSLNIDLSMVDSPVPLSKKWP